MNDPEPVLVTSDSHIRTYQHPYSYNDHLLRGLTNARLHMKTLYHTLSPTKPNTSPYKYPITSTENAASMTQDM